MPSTELVAASTLGVKSLEECLRTRRSCHDFGWDPLTGDELLGLCWAGQGITGPGGQRTAPSAGGVHPLELYVVTAAGILHYEAEANRLESVGRGDRRPALCTAAQSQDVIGLAAATVVIVAVEGRMDPRYGARSRHYELVETGHVAQNVLLAATAMGICATPVGALDDAAVRDVLDLPANHTPLYLVAVGHGADRPHIAGSR